MEIAEKIKFVKGLAPATDRWNGDPETDRVSLENFDKCVFLVHQQGGTTGKATLTVNAYAANAGGTGEPVAFSYRKGAAGAGSGGDALGKLTQATAEGFDTTAGEDALYLVEIRGDQLPEGKPFVSLQATEAADDPVNGAIEILLYRGRYEGAELPTVIE